MDNFSEKTSDHIFRLIYVVRNAANYRSLIKYKDDFDQNYWIQIFNNFFDVAILEWCKIFGTDNEPTHWKTIVDDHASFRKGLLNCTGLDESGWSKYWQEVKDYRTKAGYETYICSLSSGRVKNSIFLYCRVQGRF